MTCAARAAAFRMATADFDRRSGDRASHRARHVTATVAQAEALADLLRDHGYPARVVVGRKQGTLAIRTARYNGRRWQRARLQVDRGAVRRWLGY